MKLIPLIVSALLALALLTTQVLAAEPETIFLSSLDLSPITQGWGQPQADKAVTGKPLSIGGKVFERGVGTHADSVVRLMNRIHGIIRADVHHPLASVHRAPHRCRIAIVALDKCRARIGVAARMSEHHRLVAALEQRFHNPRTDKSGSTEHKRFH